MSWQIVGHDWAVTLLRQSLVAGRVSHAFLFCGPPQIGKTRLALTLAQALHCPQPDPPCGECATCVKIDRGVHPDVRLVQAAEPGGTVKIDQIRDLQREAALAPYEGAYRVYVLRQADRASIEAANSLLKTLEEPPPHVVLILTAVDADALPATVVSRCQRLDLRPVAWHVIEAALRARGLAPAEARLLSRLSGGRVGWALQASQDDAVRQQWDRDLGLLVELLPAGRLQRLEFASQASHDPVAVRRLIEVWTVCWRDLLLISSRRQENVVNVDRMDQLQALAMQGDLHQVWKALKSLQAAAAQVEANVNLRLALEGLLLNMPHWSPVSHGQA